MNNEMKKTKKLNNKGFSLVELIIVIAIMAVLIGVLAPQYLKYVEKSRRAADLDNFQQIISAVQVYYSDPEHALPSAGGYKIAVNTNGKVTVDTPIETACKDAGVDASKITMKSADCKNKTVVFTVTAKGNSGFHTTDTTLAGLLSIGTSAVTDPAAPVVGP